jgi:hypothetical protein
MKLQLREGPVSHTNLPSANRSRLRHYPSDRKLRTTQTQSRHCHHKSTVKSIVHLISTALPNPNASSDVAPTLPTPTQPTGSPRPLKRKYTRGSRPPHSGLAPAHKSLSRTFFPGLHETETRHGPTACARLRWGPWPLQS